MITTIVWDWNGTLLADVPLCVEVMNGLLARRGLPLLEVERYREIFTFPVREYYQAAGLDLQREPFEKLAVEYIEEYNRRALDCPLYPGAGEVLARLKELGCRQLIVSASHRDALAQQVERRGIRDFFEAVLGVGDVLGATKEGVARDYLKQKGVSSEDVLFVGDSAHDRQTALPCRCVLIANGHESRQRLEAAGGPVLGDIREAGQYIEKLIRE